MAEWIRYQQVKYVHEATVIIYDSYNIIYMSHITGVINKTFQKI